MHKYFSLVKFSHTIFAMPFALIGFFLAVRISEVSFNSFDYWILVFVIFDMIFARNAAMAFNRWLDRRIDKKNPRTSNREIPAGKVNKNFTLLFVVVNSALFMFVTYLINPLVFYLSPIALVVILGYSYTKRFTWLCHFVLGTGLSLAPIGAYLAVTAEFSILPLLFSMTVLFWTAGFDIIYALQDEEFDKKEKLKSIPVTLGKKNALKFSSFLHIIASIFIILAGLFFAKYLGYLYWVGVFLFCISLIYQHKIVKHDDLSKINIAFFTTNGVASIVFACFTIVSLYL